MSSSEFRAKAREHLSGKWGKAVCFILAYMLISFLFSFITGLFEESVLGSLLSLAIAIINVPLSFGLMASFFNLYCAKEVGAFDFVSYGFQNFKRAWGVTLRMALKLLVPILLLVVSIFLIVGGFVASSASLILNASSSGFGTLTLVGFILYIVSFIWIITKSYYYTMSYFLAIDNPEMSTKEAVEKSREIMTNNRAKLFFLELSFIGWMILSIFTLGIGLLWLSPYMVFAEIAFYHFVAKKDETVVFEETPENPTETL